MAGKQEVFDILKPSLTKAIQDWINKNSDSDEWIALKSFVGNNVAGCMSTAALSVLRGIVDVQDYLKEQGFLD